MSDKLFIQVWIPKGPGTPEAYWLTVNDADPDKVADEAYMAREYANKTDRWRVVRIVEEVVWPSKIKQSQNP